MLCRRESLTFNRDIGIRHWQELDHGLAPWVHHYFLLRNRVEHFNGYAEDHEAIERSHTHRIRKIAARSLLLSFQIAHANHRKLAAWLDTLQTDGLPARRRPFNRHKLRNPRYWTPNSYLPEPTPGNLTHPTPHTRLTSTNTSGPLRTRRGPDHVRHNNKAGQSGKMSL
ncbi:hypothetical protein ABT001_26605 [Streptomyces sp. NPDC002793]|uniref:hypothetical protein n=1 Tax=Streptomyces sp. NPDC002793 TaxID=3154432 RepID=UPI00333342EB